MVERIRDVHAHDEGRPTEGEVLAYVRKHPDGVDALAVTRYFVEKKNYEPLNVQRTIQRVLSRGRLRLGDGLRLVVREFADA